MEIICYVKWKPFKIFKQLRYKMFFQLVFRSFLTFYKLIICCSCCSVSKSSLTLCNPMDFTTWGFAVLLYLLEFAQTHVCHVDDAIQPSHLLLPPSLPALNLSQHQGLFQWVRSSHQVAKVLELQFQHQSLQRISGLISFRIDWFDLALQIKTKMKHHLTFVRMAIIKKKSTNNSREGVEKRGPLLHCRWECRLE